MAFLKEKMKSHDVFLKFCADAGIEANKRQYSKFINGKGFIYKKYILKDKDVKYGKEKNESKW
jgi:hypothetical protein